MRRYIGAGATHPNGGPKWRAPTTDSAAPGDDTVRRTGTLPLIRFGLFGTITARAGRRDVLVACLLQGAELLRQAPGCELYVVHTSPTEADVVHVMEVWRSRADHEASLAIPGMRELVSTARPLIAALADPVVTVPAGGKGIASP